MNTQQPIYQPGAQTYQPVPINKVVASKGWYIAKLTLGSCIIVFDIVLIALSAAYLNMWYTFTVGSYFALVFSPAIVSLGWQIAEFITVCVHKDRRGIHPGAHVALHLLLWLSFAITAVLLGFLVSYRSYRRYGSYNTRQLAANAEPLENAQFAFTVLVLILHFTLFVRFCIETNRRNKLPAGMIMVAAPASGMYFVPGAQPQYMVQQPQYMVQAAPQQPQAGHTSTYGGFYAPGYQPADKAVVEQQQPGAAPTAPVAPAAPAASAV